jgi:hypothetical protein
VLEIGVENGIKEIRKKLIKKVVKVTKNEEIGLIVLRNNFNVSNARKNIQHV